MYPWKVLSKWNLLSLEKKNVDWISPSFPVISFLLLSPLFFLIDFSFAPCLNFSSSLLFSLSLFPSHSLSHSLSLSVAHHLRKGHKRQVIPLCWTTGYHYYTVYAKSQRIPTHHNFWTGGIVSIQFVAEDREKPRWLFCWSSNWEYRSKLQKWPFLGEKRSLFMRNANLNIYNFLISYLNSTLYVKNKSAMCQYWVTGVYLFECQICAVIYVIQFIFSYWIVRVL